MNKAAIPLLKPTNRTRSGPVLRSCGTELIIDYDCEADDGNISWAKLIFSEVLVYEYRQAVCCSTTDIVEPTKLRVLRSSGFLSEAVKRWKEAVGWQARQSEIGGAERFGHYTVFFDDIGSVNVVAAHFEVDQKGQKIESKPDQDI